MCICTVPTTMAVADSSKPSNKPRDYDDILISLENCIIPFEKIDETPSMKDGLDRDTENELRVFACELIQIGGILLKLPQVAMATGQVILQRFYYCKSMVKHDVEVSAMAALFLAAKIEESPRRLRDVINVCNHIKQKWTHKSISPMDYFSNVYFNMKNNIIKAERRILKELGFCVHVKHPHKIIITYLQILELEKNVALARKAWNYMNDSLQSDCFVRYTPEKIACACIFLAARSLKLNLPQRPPWWILFSADRDEIEDISLAILRLYARPRRNITKLEARVNKAKKNIQARKEAPVSKEGSFTPAHISTYSSSSLHGSGHGSSSAPVKASSKNNSPQEKKATNGVRYNNSNSSKASSRSDQSRKDNPRKRRSDSQSPLQKRRPIPQSESDLSSSDSDSESSPERPSKKYARQKADYEKQKNLKTNFILKRSRSRSRSPVRRDASVSPDTKRKEKRKERFESMKIDYKRAEKVRR